MSTQSILQRRISKFLLNIWSIAAIPGFVMFQFLLKMLDDRNPGVKSVEDSGETLQKNLKPQEQRAIQNQIAQLDKRWEALNESAQERTKTLENIMGIAQEFQDCREPLIAWLDGAEKKFTGLEPSAMSVAGIENIISNLEEMERELKSKDGDVRQLAAVAKELQNHCKGKKLVREVCQTMTGCTCIFKNLFCREKYFVETENYLNPSQTVFSSHFLAFPKLLA